jgi:DNA-binding XRE family transcriptional regulator
MKRHLTEKNLQEQILFVLDDGHLYAIPKKVAARYVMKTSKAVARSENVSAEDLFNEYDEKHTKAGALLKGLRAREGLSQIKFAKKIGVSQANLSKMENGTRAIGMIVAKRIAKVFDINKDYFSE